MKSFYSYFKYIFFLSCILIIASLGGFIFWQQAKIYEWTIVNQRMGQVDQQKNLNNTKTSEKESIYPVAEEENSLFENNVDSSFIKSSYVPFDDGLFLKANIGLFTLILMILMLSYFVVYRIYIFPLPYVLPRVKTLKLNQAIPAIFPSFLNSIAEKIYAPYSEKDIFQKTPEDFKSFDHDILDQNKAQALGNVAHEIRNPLNFIANFTDVSLEYVKELKPEQIEASLLKVLEQNLVKTKEHTKRIETIVEGILAQVRGYRTIEEKVNVNSLFEEVLELTHANFNKQYNLILEKIYDENIPYFNASKEELLSVLINIIINAYFSMEEKYEKLGKNYHPRLKIETKYIRNTIKITIEDNGCGIDPLHLNKVFQPFFTTKSTDKGTGLGLAISQDIIRRHKGSLTVNSECNKFTVFTIIIPV